MKKLQERYESLWWLIVGPAIWSAHFLAAYITVAIWCAKVAPGGGSLGAARGLVASYTLVALLGIAASAWRAWRHHRHEDGRTPHDVDSPEDRYRFLGFAAFLLAALSAVGVVYSTLPILFIGSCR